MMCTWTLPAWAQADGSDVLIDHQHAAASSPRAGAATMKGDRLLKAEEACELLRVCPRMLWTLVQSQAIPAPIRIRRARLWWESELVRSLERMRIQQAMSVPAAPSTVLRGTRSRRVA